MKFLLCTDGSRCSEVAARFISNLNVSSDDEITVLHVLRWLPIQDDVESYYANLKYFRQEIAPMILDSAVEILEPVEARVSTALVEGDIDKSIVEAAVNSDVDLIVMGARGIKGLKSLFLGSVTRSVAINSPKPILVTKPLMSEKSEITKILFATDGSDYSDATAGLLASVPFPDQTPLVIMNVVVSAVSDIPERFVMEIDDKIKDEVAKARTIEFEESGKIIEQAKPYLESRFATIEELTRIGDPSMEILSAAEKFEADLIAVGCRGLRGIKGMMGSVSRRILSHAHCSVLIGKKSDVET